MQPKKFIPLFIIALLFFSYAHAETVKLKSGQQVAGKIVEKNDAFIKVENNGITSIYFLDEVESMQEKASELASEPSSEINRLIKEKNFASASEYANKALESNPNSPEILVDLGLCYYMLGQYELAAEKLNKSLEFDPKSQKAYSILGMAYQAMGMKQEAKKAYLKLADIIQETDPFRAIFIKKILEEYPNY